MESFCNIFIFGAVLVLLFIIVWVYYCWCKTLWQTFWLNSHVFSYASGGQRSTVGLTGPKIKSQQFIPSLLEVLRGHQFSCFYQLLWLPTLLGLWPPSTLKSSNGWPSVSHITSLLHWHFAVLFPCNGSCDYSGPAHMNPDKVRWLTITIPSATLSLLCYVM